MSQERLIRQGMIAERKQQIIAASIKGKKELQALLNCALLSKGKDMECVDVDALRTHLEAVTESQAIAARLVEEIKDLEES